MNINLGISLDGLNDVDSAGKSNGDALRWNSTTNKWEDDAVDTTPTSGSTNLIDSNAVFDALATKDSHIESAKKNHNFVAETVARVANNSWTYTGTVRNVPADFATITAARTASSSGDIIQLADGIYDIAAEAGGYLIVNDSKRILIRGNATDPTAVVIRQSSAASFCLRFRHSNETTFQDLTVESNQATATVTASMDTAASPVTFCFKRCILKNTSSSNINTVNIIGVPVNNCRFEFQETDIYQSSNASSNAISQSAVSDANSITYYLPILVTNCNIFGRVSFGGASDLNFYDNVFKCSQNTIIFAIGSDTAAPTFFASHVDLRCNSFEFTGSFTNHAVLLGRGTKDVYFVNNKILMNSGVNVLSIGVVIKSIAATIGDVTIDGNYIEAPRPLYIKGGQYCYVRNNTSVSVWGDATNGFGFELNNPNNPDGDISSIGNVINENNFIGIKGGIGLTSEAAITAIASAKLCVFRNNIYSVPESGVYISNPVTLWSDRYLTWKQDVNSLYFDI